MQNIIAILSNGIIVNTALFDNDGYKIAKSFLEAGTWDFLNADDVQVLPDGFGIGDSYINGEFLHKDIPDIKTTGFAEPALLDLNLLSEPEPSNADIAQMISDLMDTLVYSGMIKSNNK